MQNDEMNKANSPGRLVQFRRYIYLFLVIVYAGTVVFTAWYGPSIYQDDHWYMNDVRTFLETGRMQTNEIYPVMLSEVTPGTPVVLHNLPLMYVVMPFVLLFGYFWGWIVANIVFSLLTCLPLVLIARHYGANILQQMAVTALFLFWTITVHVSAHPLAEAGILLFVMLTGYCWLLVPPGILKQILLGFLTALVALNRSSFLAFTALFIILMLVWGNGRFLRRLWQTIVFIIAFCLFYRIGTLLLPQINLSVFSCLKLPATQAMLHFYTLHPLHFQLPVYLHKLLDNFRLQMMGRSISHTVFVTLFNLLAVWFLLRLPRGENKPGRELYLFIWLNLLTYAATLIWFQYQTRFLQTVMPFLIVWFVLTIPEKRSQKWYYIAIIAFCVICFTGNLGGGRQNRRDARLTTRVEQSFRYVQQKYHPEGAILVEGNSKVLPWVFRENTALLMFDAKVSTQADLQYMRSRVPYQWLICQSASTALDSLSTMHPVHVSAFPAPMSEWSLYRLR